MDELGWMNECFGGRVDRIGLEMGSGLVMVGEASRLTPRFLA